MHHRFKDYCWNGRKDWFHIEFAVLQRALDEFQVMIDGTPSSFTFDEKALLCNTIDQLEQSASTSEDESDEEFIYQETPQAFVEPVREVIEPQ